MNIKSDKYEMPSAVFTSGTEYARLGRYLLDDMILFDFKRQYSSA